MDIKSVGIFLLILIAGFYFAPYIDTIFSIHPDECEPYYNTLQQDTYSLSYGDRLKGVSKKCF